jgi:hypothetical protein
MSAMLEPTAIFLLGACTGITTFWALALLMIRPYLHRLLDEERGVGPRLIRVIGEVADHLELLDARVESLDIKVGEVLDEGRQEDLAQAFQKP